MTRIRDPIHGSIDVDVRERAVIDAPFFQRLRSVRQLGFSDLAFPGATHSRYAHALGACHLVGRMFDAIRRHLDVPEAEARRLRSAVRLATLLHDLGHAPFSHASEPIMPPRSALGLPGWLVNGEPERRATHEDYTLQLLLASELTDVINRHYRPDGLPPEAIASLLSGRSGPFFVVGGVDHGPLLAQVASSELDADRMDYLLRDSFYTGVSYGKIDMDWLISHLGAHVHDGVAELALGHRAIFAFEDFLLSRYHMFLSVYYHHTPTCFDHMLKAYYHDAPGEFEIAADPNEYLHCDDVALLGALRQSTSPWARRITRREPYSVLVEVNPYDTGFDVKGSVEHLAQAGIEHFVTRSRGIVSKYFGTGGRDSVIWVEIPAQRRFVPLEEYSPLFRRYEDEVHIERIYVPPEALDEARSRL